MKLLKNLLKSPAFLLGASLFLLTLLLALFGPFLFDVNVKTRVGLAYMAPSDKALLGTDHLGLDMVSLLVAGLRSSLYVGFLAGTIATVVGTLIGVYGGYNDWTGRAGRFRSPGDGQIDFKTIFSRLTGLGYEGWATLEWECCFKNKYDGAREGRQFISDHLIKVTESAFDAGMRKTLEDKTVASILGIGSR